MAKHVTRKSTEQGKAFKNECRYRAAFKRRSNTLDVAALEAELHGAQGLRRNQMGR